MSPAIAGGLMSGGQLTFSIVVPVHNGGDFFRRCLSSLKTLAFDPSRYEIIAVDNNSTDQTPQIIEEFGVVHARETNFQSSYAARNKGIECARGRFIAFTD